MDIKKEREAFEKLPEIKKRLDMKCVHFNGTWYATNPHMGNSFATASYLNGAWSAWQAKAQAVPEWISVEDEFPKDGARVLCYGRQFMCVGVFDGDNFFDPLDGQSFVKDCVTHWMQLPASPKAQEPAND